MTVAELIDRLQGLNPDDEVMVGYPSRDYWRREIARPARRPDEGLVTPSAYHGQGTFLVIEGEVEDATAEARPVVLI